MVAASFRVVAPSVERAPWFHATITVVGLKEMGKVVDGEGVGQGGK